MSETYDPVPETVELRRLRVGTPLRAPAMGTVLVLERAVGEPVLVHHGERVPDRRIGNYRRMHRVVTTTRAVSVVIKAPSKDPAFPFSVTVRFGCQVVDPVAIARDGVHDIAAALRPSLAAIVQETTVGYDVLQSNAAAAAVAERLNTAYPLSAVRLTSFSASADALDTAEIVTTTRELRVEEIRRAAMRPIAGGGRTEMLAHIMAKTGGDPTPLLEREQAAREANTRASLDALRVLMGSTEKMEEFNTAEIRKHAVGTFFPDAKPLGTAGTGAIRERLERKVKGELDSPAVVEGNTPTHSEPPAQPADSPAADGNGNGHPPSRLRGTAAGSGGE
ncbi:hypothetical protein [Amycolatopsis sp. YIM 10]|uniref:hypothetical protein n=1 Tax=Amycolatopsis sp. YIM 10 TaxID=2653857 RepID=UPI00128FEAB4|nr:hypothetical protein [Amycolatopsis sp. YIM 10]QFU90763.1 hypothetical protein YIM_27945 [Amycolatopsis sp. YIM 10]